MSSPRRRSGCRAGALRARCRDAPHALHRHRECHVTRARAPPLPPARARPLSRLQEEGFVLLQLRAVREADLQTAAVFRFEAAAQPRRALRPPLLAPGAPALPASVPPASLKAELPFHRLMPGDMVSASPGDAPPEPGATDALTGVVLERGPAWVKLAVSEAAADALARGGASWRIDLAANAVAHERMLAALMRFAAPGAMPSRGSKNSGGGGLATARASAGYAPLQRALLGGAAAAAAAEAAPHWLPAGAAGAKAARAAADAATRGLNDSQRAAVAAALGRTLTLWQGPPGTGKTRTLLALIRAAVAQQRGGADGGGTGAGPARRGPAVLACAPSNVAVDNIVEGLLAASGPAPLRVIRLGAPAKVAPQLRGVTLHAAAAGHPAAIHAASLREQARAADGPSAAAALRHLARESEAEAYSDTLAAADVVAATCSGAGDDALGELTFRFVLIDEATQATEPAALVPLVRGHAAVLVGDVAQLPPTVIAAEAAAGGLATSLPERLALRVAAAVAAVPDAAEAPGLPPGGAGLSPLLLDTQYRMHPGLAAFPSQRFYGGRLRSGVDAAARPAPRGFRWPSARVPLAFLDVAAGAEERTALSGSVANPAEATALARLLARLLPASGLAPSDIGVLTPYAGQVRAVQRALAAALPPDAAAAIEVRTVDGFQGREKELILFSAVRANDARALGFTADARRLNVAITRARRGLIVLGHRRTLDADPNWAAWLRWVDAAGAAADA
jgi:hypothetical protein